MFGWLSSKQRGSNVNVRSTDASARRLGVLTWDGMFAERLSDDGVMTTYRSNGLTFRVHNDYHDFTLVHDVALDVVFVPQHGRGADLSSNDCGPACALSLLRSYGYASSVSVNDLVRSINASNGRYTSIAENVGILRRFGLPSSHTNALNAAQACRYLNARRPVIALVNYAHLIPFGRRFSHFIVLTGCQVRCQSLYFLVNDPLQDGPHLVSAGDLRRALSEPIANIPYQGIVPDVPLPIHDVLVDGT